MKLLDTINEHKEPLFMMFGTIGVIADVALCIRNGAKMKEKLEDLDEDADNLDKLKVIAPELAEIIALTGFSLGCFWFARKINIDRIVSAGSMAALYKQRAENQDKAVQEVVSKEQYSDIQQREKEMRESNQIRPRVYDGDGDTLMVCDISGVGIDTTLDKSQVQFAKFQRDMTSSVCNCNERSDGKISVASYLEYMFPTASFDLDHWRTLGWTDKEVSRMELMINYPDGGNPANNIWGRPYVKFSPSIKPHDIPKDW